MSISEDLLLAEAELAQVSPSGLPQDFRALGTGLLDSSDQKTFVSAAPVAMRICRHLYGRGRSFDAMPIAFAVYGRATEIGHDEFARQAANACGLLSTDTADFAGAIEFHGRAIELMGEKADATAASRVWNNIGSAFTGAGQFDLAVDCFQRSLEKIEALQEPHFSRYSALTNLAQCHYHRGDIDSGLSFANLALDELHSDMGVEVVDPYSQIILRRNIVRLMVEGGKVSKAEPHAQHAISLAKADGKMRALIAASTTLAVLDIARGNIDMALTRLDRALTDSRSVWPSLRDTLTCVVRAEAKAGNPERALIRLRELSELVHDRGARAAQTHIAMTGWRNACDMLNPFLLRSTEVCLRAQINSPTAPSSWQTLSRLAIGNALQVDVSSAHGLRVGALTRLLAQAYGYAPIDALEVGLAAQVHDIGMASGHENLLQRHSRSTRYASHVDAEHCEAGWIILSEDSHPRLMIARDIAKYHHAWWNGNGYPSGVAGQAIPLYVRMCAVADAYDTLLEDGEADTHNSMGKALVELESLAGSRLDPDLVRCFIEAIRSEAGNEQVPLEKDDGLSCFHQLIDVLTSGRNFV